MLTHCPDPFQRQMFGGDPSSLQHATSYLKSMHELAKTTESLRRKGGGKGEADQSDKEKGARTAAAGPSTRTTRRALPTPEAAA